MSVADARPGAFQPAALGVTSLHSDTGSVDCDGLSFITIDGTPFDRKSLPGSSLFFKRLLDIIAATSGIVVLLPFFILTALVIKAGSPGPVLFRQRRVGKNARHFDIFKFRTMYADLGDDSGISQTTLDDPRITRVGHFLRRTSLDELPQLFNVLIGDMSLVGPRPHVEGQLANSRPYAELVPYYEMRYAMRPGITGWAQANGLRGPTTDPEPAKARIDYDIAYIQNFSFALDMRILWKTAYLEFLNGSGN